MNFLLAKFDKWAEDEGEEIMNYYWKNYGPLPQISCIFASFKRSMLPVTLSTIVFHTTILVLHLILLGNTFLRTLVEWDMELCSLAAHFVLLIIMDLFCLYNFLYNRETLVTQSSMASKDIGNYKSGHIYSEKWCVKAKDENWKETLRYLCIPLAIGIGSGIILILPYTMKTIKGLDNPYGTGMVNTHLPFSCWYPFPTHEGVLHGVALVGQILAALCGASTIVQSIVLFLVNSQRIKYEMSVVGYSLKTLFPRSMKLYCQMNPGTNKKSVNVRDPRYQRVIQSCLTDSVIHHHKIRELLSMITVQLDVIGFLAYLIGTGVIGISLFNILAALNTDNYESLILFLVMIFCETLVMFILSLVGEAITDRSVALRDELYFVGWYNLDLRNRKILLNFHTAMTEPLVITVMGLINLSLDTFSSIMNTAYSFFNLMNTQTVAR